jgi:ABC-type branched-subunit amino acid transport system permease subunit
MSSKTVQRAILIGIPLIVAAAYQGNSYALTLLVFVLINGCLAMGTSLCMGHAGQITLAQGGFFAIGAYTAALLALKFQTPFVVCVAAAIGVSTLAGYALGYPVLRVKGHYLGLITLAFTLLVHEIALHWTSVTGGVNGLYGMKRPEIPFLQFDPAFEFVLMLAVYWAVTYIGLDNLTNSRYGRAMHALKFSEWGAQASGINIARYKTEAFAISAGVMGGAGAFYANFLHYIGPESFLLDVSIGVAAMCILGGMADLRGAIVGSALLTVLNEPLRNVPALQPIVYAVVIIATIILLPKGIVPTIAERLQNIRRSRARAS